MFIASKQTNKFNGPEIKNFIGQKRIQETNFLSVPLGQLIYNKNMEYHSSGGQVYLQTRRGSNLIKDIEARSRGAAEYVYNRTTHYKVWMDWNGNLKYYDEASDKIKIIKSNLDGDNQNYFVMYGADTAAVLYGNNPTNGVYKISGASLTYATVTSPLMDHLAYSGLAGRNFGVKGHNLYWTERQIHASDMTNLENWNIGTNTQPISPDDGKGFNCTIDNGEALFMFKDTGAWILPNPEGTPATDWAFPKANADVGTRSPRTVKIARYGNVTGIIHLGSDKTVRFFSARIIRNAGSFPTIDGGDSKVISDNFQNSLLKTIPDAYIDKCHAVYKDRYYILHFPSTGDTEVSKTIVIDTEKLEPLQEDIPQPYWFEAEGMDYVDYIVRKDTNILYGLHKKGYISQLFVDGVFVDNVPERIDDTEELAIEWAAYLGWYKYSNVELEFVGGYLYWAVEGNWSVNFCVNSFVEGEAVPDYDDASEVALYPAHVEGSYFDVSLFDVARFGSEQNQLSQTINKELRGNYFLFGFYNNNKSEPATIYGITPIFKKVRVSPFAIR